MKRQADLLQEEPWETLIILDACRHDKFKEVVEEKNILGKLEPCLSPAQHTADWYLYYWGRKKTQDIVLISAQIVPWVSDWTNGVWQNFYRAIHTWKHGTDFPSIKATMDEAEKQRLVFPDKKLLIHLIPPHLPFIGPKGVAFTQSKFGSKPQMYSQYSLIQKYGRQHGWEEIQFYYKESIETAMSRVLAYKWLKNAVITADHGELIGEGGFYNHGRYLKSCEALRVVPWFRLEK